VIKTAESITDRKDSTPVLSAAKRDVSTKVDRISIRHYFALYV
jgi:hypothetical protein